MNRRDSSAPGSPGTGNLGPDTPSWAERLRALGAILDRDGVAGTDFCVLDVEGGFVVQIVQPDPTGHGEGQIVTREITQADLAVAQPPPDATPHRR